MRSMTSRERESLDRYITGNYGEDQFPEPYDDDEVEAVCFKCEYLMDHPFHDNGDVNEDYETAEEDRIWYAR